MSEAQLTGGRPSWAAPATAWALAGLTMLLAVALIPLSLTTRQNPPAAGGASVVIALSFAVVGLVVAWHRPRNPIGWLMLALAVSFILDIDSGLYNVLDYRLGYRLPLAPAVLLMYHVSEQPVAAAGATQGGSAIQPGPVRRRPDRHRVRGAAEGHRGSGFRAQ